MLVLTEFYVSTFARDTATVTWSFESTNETISGYTLSLYKSEAPSTVLTDYDIIASGITADNYTYTDVSLSGLYSDNRNWYYLASVINTLTGETNTQPTTPAYLKINTTSTKFSEILRRKNLVLQRFSARETIYFVKRRTWVTFCTTCWNATLQRVSEENCATCFGTGYVGGYFSPVSIYGMINSAPKYNQITMFGQFMPSDAIMYMTNFPVVTPQDVIVDAINRR